MPKHATATLDEAAPDRAERLLLVADRLDEVRELVRENRLDEAQWRLDAAKEAFADAREAASCTHMGTTGLDRGEPASRVDIDTTALDGGEPGKRMDIHTGGADAELIAIAEQTGEASRVHGAALKRVEEIEARDRPPAPPAALIRTAQDAALKLFVGSPIGSAYNCEEIPSIRVFCRAAGKAGPEGPPLAAYRRSLEILEAWREWQEALAAHEARTGLAAANRAYDQATEAFDALAERLVTIPARTIEGTLAKARALRAWILDDAAIEKSLTDSVRRFSVDEDVVALSVLRDVTRLAREGDR